MQYLDTVFDSLARAGKESELTAIREELRETGYIKSYKGKSKKPEKLLPVEYRSSDGFTILVGRNNVQNDRLTLKDAHNYDMWFHTQKIPGSHTVVVADGKRDSQPNAGGGGSYRRLSQPCPGFGAGAGGLYHRQKREKAGRCKTRQSDL